MRGGFVCVFEVIREYCGGFVFAISRDACSVRVTTTAPDGAPHHRSYQTSRCRASSDAIGTIRPPRNPPMKVLFEKSNHIAYVTINRPERLNACDFETYARLAEIWTEFRDDSDLRVAILTGVRRARVLRRQRCEVELRRSARRGSRKFSDSRSCSNCRSRSSRLSMAMRTAAAWNRRWRAISGLRRSTPNSASARCVSDGCRAEAERSGCRA